MSHQNRRAPLPKDYQFPTHGVDCDCPPCRNSVATFQGYTATAPGGSVTVDQAGVFTLSLRDGSTMTAWPGGGAKPVACLDHTTGYGFGV